MRRLLMILPSLIVLAACTDAPPPASVEQVRASFPPGAVVNLIKIDAADPQPLRSAELVAPDGTATPASSLEVDKTPQTIGGSSTVGDPWRSSMLGTNGISQLPGGQADPAYRSRQTLLVMMSTAEIPLPDPVAYRRDWANYRIRLSFGGAGDPLDTREIAAPQPPPG